MYKYTPIKLEEAKEFLLKEGEGKILVSAIQSKGIAEFVSSLLGVELYPSDGDFTMYKFDLMLMFFISIKLPLQKIIDITPEELERLPWKFIKVERIG